MSEQVPPTEDRGVSIGGDLVGSAVVTGDNNIVSVVYQTLSGKEALEEADSNRNLQLLLSKVKSFWIGGVLTHATADGRICIRKITRHEAVERPFERQLLRTGSPEPQMVEEISQSFDQYGRMLLILGQPGAGKTITLLELTHDLINRAEQDTEHPVPVVLMLSSWPGNEVSLDEWIENELSSQYQIPRDIGHIWLKRKRLLPLLDGLDEVEPEQQVACIKAIQSLIEDTGVPGLAVSSRSEEYKSLPARLKLGGAVELQPLTDEQIRQTIGHSPDHPNSDGYSGASHLGELLDRHEALANVVHSPLMLNIAENALDGIRSLPESVSMDSESDCREFLFDAYVNRMFENEELQKKPSNADKKKNKLGLMSQLSWLGRKMIDHRKGLFLIEDLQPSWLRDSKAKLVNLIVISMTMGLLSGLIAMLGSIGFSPILDAIDVNALDCACLIVQVPLWILIIGIVDLFQSRNRIDTDFRVQSYKKGLLKGLLYFAIWFAFPAIWMLGSFLFGYELNRDGIVLNLMMGVVFCSFAGAVSRRERLALDIRTVEALAVSPRKAMQGVGFGLLGGLLVYFTYFFLVPTESFPYFWTDPVEVFSIIAYPMCGGIVGLFLTGIVSRVDTSKTQPNQGMRESRRNALVVGISVFIACCITTLCMLLLMSGIGIKDYTIAECFFASLAFGMLMGYLAGLWFGGLSLLKHYLLRFQLAAEKSIPWNIEATLDRATDLNLTRQVGGGFMFAHGLLREHFAIKHSCDDVSE